MPSDIIKKQLLSLELAIPSSYDPETNSYFIPKYSGDIYSVGKSYLIELNSELLLTDKIYEWENTRKPSSKYLKITVNQSIAKMIQVMGVEADLGDSFTQTKIWEGWLNIDYIKQIKPL